MIDYFRCYICCACIVDEEHRRKRGYAPPEFFLEQTSSHGRLGRRGYLRSYAEGGADQAKRDLRSLAVCRLFWAPCLMTSSAVYLFLHWWFMEDDRPLGSHGSFWDTTTWWQYSLFAAAIVFFVWMWFGPSKASCVAHYFVVCVSTMLRSSSNNVAWRMYRPELARAIGSHLGVAPVPRPDDGASEYCFIPTIRV